jgi:hypothetical protein
MVHRVAQIHTNPRGERIVRTNGDHTPASIPKLDYPISEVLYRQTHVCYSESGLNCQTVFSAGKLHFCWSNCCCHADNNTVIHSKRMQEKAKRKRKVERGEAVTTARQ